MDSATWLALCYRALGIPETLSDQDRRRQAEHVLLERTRQPIDILGLGAAEAAIDLVVRYGEAGELSDVMLRWEQAEYLAPEMDAALLGDEGTRRATACAKELVRAVVQWLEHDGDEADEARPG